MFNSRQYEWADVTVLIGGADITGIRGVKYTEKIEREAIYGKGRNPISIQSGNRSIEGEVTLLQSELEALTDAANGANGKSILNLSVDIDVSYGDGTDGNVMKHDTIEGVRFTEVPRELKQGDKFMEITIPFIALNVKQNS